MKVDDVDGALGLIGYEGAPDGDLVGMRDAGECDAGQKEGAEERGVRFHGN